MGWDDGDAFGGNPFGDTSADCFGHAIEDVDPFQEGNDSFGGDKEWTTFNDDGSEDGSDSRTSGRTRQSSSKSGRDSSRSQAKSSGTRSRSGHRRPPSNRQERPSSGTSSSTRRTNSKGRPASRNGRSPSPATSSSGRRKLHVDPNPTTFDRFKPEDAGDNPFRVGMDSPSMPSPTPEKFVEGNFGFADFDSAFDDPQSGSPTMGRKQSSSSRMRNQAKVIHDRRGRAQRLTSSEERSRIKNSESRRSAVKDSIFSSLSGFDDDEDAENNIGLSAFLTEKSGRNHGRRRKGAGSGDSIGGNSTQSAPAANHGHYKQRQHRSGSANSTSNDDAYVYSNRSSVISPRRASAGKSLRGRLPPAGAPRRSRGVTSEADHGNAHQQKLRLDVAALAEHGHLEVVDGKMRLVFDVDTIAR